MINFSYNAIVNFPRDLFKECNQLYSIDFSYNTIEDLNENKVSENKKSSSLIGNSSNEIDHQHKGIFQGCSKLGDINFCNNKLKYLNENLLREH